MKGNELEMNLKKENDSGADNSTTSRNVFLEVFVIKLQEEMKTSVVVWI